MTELMDRPSTNAFAEARKLCLRHQRRVRRLVTFLVVLLVLAGFITAAAFTVAMPCRVVGSDMQPTLAAGSIALVNTLRTSPARGEVIACTDAEGTLLLRRVIGLPGDRVAIDRTTGQVSVNGTPLAESYISRSAVGNMDIADETEVPKGKLFLLGDERLAARDSRQEAFGLLPLTAVRGQVWGVIWPLTEWKMVK